MHEQSGLTLDGQEADVGQVTQCPQEPLQQAHTHTCVRRKYEKANHIREPGRRGMCGSLSGVAEGIDCARDIESGEREAGSGIL